MSYMEYSANSSHSLIFFFFSFTMYQKECRICHEIFSQLPATCLRKIRNVLWLTFGHWQLLHFYFFHHVSSSNGDDASEVRNMLYSWLHIYYSGFFRFKRCEESVCPHGFQRGNFFLSLMIDILHGTLLHSWLSNEFLFNIYMFDDMWKLIISAFFWLAKYCLKDADLNWWRLECSVIW